MKNERDTQLKDPFDLFDRILSWIMLLLPSIVYAGLTLFMFSDFKNMSIFIKAVWIYGAVYVVGFSVLVFLFKRNYMEWEKK